MDFSIASILMLDGFTNGAVYALLGLATVLVFTVTRVIFIPQGEFVAYGALTLAMLQAGKVPGTVWLLMILATVASLMECWSRWHHDHNLVSGLKAALRMWIPPMLIALLTWWSATQNFSMLIQALLSVAVVATFGPLVYRIAYQSLESATPLVLLIVSVGVHFAMTGFGLLVFGAEGFRNPSFLDQSWSFGPLTISGQVFIIFLIALIMILVLWLFFERTLFGKALRATACGVVATGVGRDVHRGVAHAGRLSDAPAAKDSEHHFAIGLIDRVASYRENRLCAIVIHDIACSTLGSCCGRYIALGICKDHLPTTAGTGIAERHIEILHAFAGRRVVGQHHSDSFLRITCGEHQAPAASSEVGIDCGSAAGQVVVDRHALARSPRTLYGEDHGAIGLGGHQRGCSKAHHCRFDNRACGTARSNGVTDRSVTQGHPQGFIAFCQCIAVDGHVEE